MGSRSALVARYGEQLCTPGEITGAEIVPPLPGTYILWWEVEEPRRVQVGRLGEFDLPPGLLAYTGSARGPGGLAARIARHLRYPKPLRWHVDALQPGARPVAIGWAVGRERQECRWAAVLAQIPGASPIIPGFGASDCPCRAHLFHFPPSPEGYSGYWRAFRQRVTSNAGLHLRDLAATVSS